MGKKVENKNSSRERVSKCAVCMQKNSYVTINCVHKFCMRCITRWVKVYFNLTLEKSKLSPLQDQDNVNKTWEKGEGNIKSKKR